MKKIVWLILAACVLAFGQVQPVASTAAKSDACGCCDCDGTCGMPDCLPAPVARVPVFAKSAPRTELTEIKRRQLPSKLELVETFCGRSQVPVSTALAFAPSRPLPVVNAPVFLLHCSFLI
jgi:hypothetical protein